MSAEPSIERLDVSAYTVPTDTPEADGTLSWSSTTLVVVEPVAGGLRGLGWSYTDAAAAQIVRAPLADAVVGRSALDVPGAAEAMVRAVRNLGRSGLAATAISAVDIALWDLKARLLGRPLAHLLGRAHDRVPIYGSGGFTSYDDARTREQLHGWVGELGIPRVKIKIADSWGSNERRDLARIALARSVIGEATELYVDANGGYTRGQAVRVARAFADHDVRWFEEPVSSDDLAGLAGTRTQVLPDVAAGEYGYDLGYFTRMCAAGAVDCLQIDVTRCGGVTEWLRAAAVAAGHQLDVSAHCAPNLHAPVAGAVPNLRHIEYFHDHARIEGLLFDGALDPTGGSLVPRPDVVGLGLQLRRADADRYRVG